MTQTSDLLTKVVQRTKEGKLSWDSTPKSVEMLTDLVLTGSTPRIYYTQIANLILRVTDPPFPPSHPVFTVFDEHGMEIDSISYDTDVGYWRLELNELVRAARISAMGAEDKYAAALAALDETG